MSKVEIYTWRFCPFCIRAKSLLEKKNINPLKDSSAALMQASSKKKIEVWTCTPQDLEARGDEVWASSIRSEVNPWISFKDNECIPLAEFNCIWTVSYTHLTLPTSDLV